MGNLDDFEIIGMLKTYVKQSLEGAGALQGPPCQIQGIVDNGDGTQTVTFLWEDDEGNSHTTEMETPSAIYEFALLQDGQIMYYDATDGKWKNGNMPTLGTAAAADSTSSVTENSNDLLTSGGAFTALGQKADKGTSLSDYGITNAYTKTETDSAISTEIGKLDVTDTATAGSYVTAVSEADGKINVTREAADETPAANSKKLITSGGAKTALDAKVAWDDFNELGAVNLFDNNAESKEDAGSGLTLTIGNDKKATVSATSGSYPFTATGLLNVPVISGGKIPQLEDGKTYKISGCPSGGSSTKYECFVADATASTYLARDYGEGAEFTYDASHNYNVGYCVRSGCELTADLVFEPMITLPDYSGDYVPFAKTNKQLTDEQGYFTDDQWAQVTALLT